MTFGTAGDRQFDALSKHIRLGYGADVDVRIVETHHSKSNKLPIVAAECAGWNTSVAWYADNYHNTYSAFRFERAIPTTLLYPISGTFGRKHMSGHEADCPLPDITNFQKDYWNRRTLAGFAGFAGDWHLATTLRYLEAVSKIDTKALFDCVMDDTNYGRCDNIDGNAINFKEMSRIVGIPLLDTYDKNVVLPENQIVKKLQVDWYGVQTDIHPTCVEVETQPGVLLPAPTGTGKMYVDPADTRLGEHLGENVQLRWSEETKYDLDNRRMLTFVPADVFKYFPRDPLDYRGRKAHIDATPWKVCGAYSVTTLDTRLFRFEVPNPLDAVLFVKWWLDAAIPCAEAALAARA